jgi:exonuclease III
VNPAASFMLSLGISVAAQNCNSLNVSSIKNQDLKLSAIINYKTDVVLLSDIRLNCKHSTIMDKLGLWYTVYYNSSKNSRGVAVLISKQVEHSVAETAVDPQENALLLKVNVRGKIVILGSVYGPNDNNCLPFFTFVNNTLAGWSNIPVILGGDWNATPSSLPVNENPDVAFMPNIPSLVRTEQIRLLCELADLSDPFRTLHPDLRDFSYHPSGDTRKNRSRIDFFLISTSLYGYIESCTIAQGFCRRSFDYKPIFLCLKKRQVKGRAFIHDCTINHPLSVDIVKLAVHKTTIFASMVDAGPLTMTILDSELEKLEQIEVLINRIIVLRGMATTGDLNPDLEGELLAATTELPTLWNNSATLYYLRGFDRQVQNDVFFEELVSCTKEAMLSLQSKIKEAESKNKRNWTIELSILKTGNYVANFERICHLETLLNNASEKFVSDRIGNFIKTDVLNSEKMTPRFLKLAESNISSEISEIKDDNGTPFDCDKKGRFILLTSMKNYTKFLPALGRILRTA